MLSRFFIDRPIVAVVLSTFIVLAGLAAMRVLPVAQYPEIAPPVVTVQAVYPGASAQVIEQTVAAPLENAINGVERMLYMSSNSSSNGLVQIQVTFDIGTDVDQAALNVNNRVKQAEARLPEEVRRQGVTVEKGSSAFLQVLAFYSDAVGPFSYEKMANITSPATGGGMEAASAIMYGENAVTGTRARRWQLVIIHEIAHQWFGNAVTEYDWDDVWLSEGFATYFGHLFFEDAEATAQGGHLGAHLVQDGRHRDTGHPAEHQHTDRPGRDELERWTDGRHHQSGPGNREQRNAERGESP